MKIRARQALLQLPGMLLLHIQGLGTSQYPLELRQVFSGILLQVQNTCGPLVKQIPEVRHQRGKQTLPIRLRVRPSRVSHLEQLNLG